MRSFARGIPHRLLRLSGRRFRPRTRPRSEIPLTFSEGASGICGAEIPTRSICAGPAIGGHAMEGVAARPRLETGMTMLNRDRGEIGSFLGRLRCGRALPGFASFLLGVVIVIGIASRSDPDERRARLAAGQQSSIPSSSDVGRRGDALPITPDISVEACTRTGGLTKGCIGSETTLRPLALDAWSSATAEVRQACLDDARGAAEPVGVLFACLRAQDPAARSPERPR